MKDLNAGVNASIKLKAYLAEVEMTDCSQFKNKSTKSKYSNALRYMASRIADLGDTQLLIGSLNT